MKTLLYILTWVGCLTLWVIVLSVGEYLLKTKIIIFKYEFLEYFYYVGLGILAWFPCDYMCKQVEK